MQFKGDNNFFKGRQCTFIHCSLNTNISDFFLHKLDVNEYKGRQFTFIHCSLNTNISEFFCLHKLDVNEYYCLLPKLMKPFLILR